MKIIDIRHRDAMDLAVGEVQGNTLMQQIPLALRGG